MSKGAKEGHYQTVLRWMQEVETEVADPGQRWAMLRGMLRGKDESLTSGREYVRRKRGTGSTQEAAS